MKKVIEKSHFLKILHNKALRALFFSKLWHVCRDTCDIQGITALHKINHFYLDSILAHTLHYCCSAHISHSSDDGRVRNSEGRRINKQSHKPANDLSPGWKSLVSRASLSRKMSFQVRAADQKVAEIKFTDGYGKVTTILLLSANLQIEIVRDLIQRDW